MAVSEEDIREEDIIQEDFKKAKEIERILNIADVSGIVLSVSGVFLPWGEWEYVPIMGANYIFGCELTLGQFALIGCMVTIVSLLLFVIRKKKRLLTFMLLGEITTLLCTFIWIIATPGISKPWVRCSILYGTHTTLTGGFLNLISSIARKSFKI